jgi:glyoxylase-like metal-dependent hydrolase (beta-lactamase superfamily II)
MIPGQVGLVGQVGRVGQIAVVLLALQGCVSGPPDASTVIRGAQKALGAEALTAISYSGSMKEFGVGQSDVANGPWPHIFNYQMTRAFEFEQPKTHLTLQVLSTSPLIVQMPPPPPPPGSSAAPPPLPPPFHMVTDANSRWEQQLEIWVTPWAFLRGALANQATVAARSLNGKRYDVVSWASPQKSPAGLAYRLNGYLNGERLLEKIETWVENDFFGDMLVEMVFADYKDFGGVKVPTKIVQAQGGWPRFETTISEATPNPPNVAQLLQAPPSPAMPPPGGPENQETSARSERLADGVYRITGGYVALAVEFADHIVIIEGPENDARARAIIAEARKVIPNKSIKYVVNTHHHSDHAGGLPAFAAEGAVIVTHQNNQPLFERAFNRTRTLAPDALGVSKRKATFETVGDVKVLKDDTRVVELHHVKGLAHADGMLIAYLPKEKIVVQADMAFVGPFQPGAGERRTTTLVQNLERLKLDYETVVFVHAPEPDRRMTRTDLLKLAAAEKN